MEKGFFQNKKAPARTRLKKGYSGNDGGTASKASPGVNTEQKEERESQRDKKKEKVSEIEKKEHRDAERGISRHSYPIAANK